MSTNYPGIDYSGLGGTCNRDAETGIRYGILSANTPELSEWFWESVESVYNPRCPKCGNDATPLDKLPDEDLDDDTNAEGWEKAQYDCIEFGCESCEYLFGESAYGDEPDGNVLQGEGIEGFVDSSNDIWVTKSEFYTYAQFCSPCAPGAGYLNNSFRPDEDVTPLDDAYCRAAELAGFPKVYCLGGDWFQGVAPYPIFSVKDNMIAS